MDMMGELIQNLQYGLWPSDHYGTCHYRFTSELFESENVDLNLSKRCNVKIRVYGLFEFQEI